MGRIFVELSMLAWCCVSLQAEASSPTAHVHYSIDTSGRVGHSLHVSLRLDAGHEATRFHLPTWYATYQIRNFSQYLRAPKAFAADGSELPVHSIDKTTWTVSGGGKVARFDYDVVCNLPGPYGLEVSASRITINPALLLVYSHDTTSEPLEITFQGVPAEWQVASTLSGGSRSFFAKNYEQIADSPFWIGSFSEKTYTEGHTTIRIVVDADSKDYDIEELVRRNHRLVSIERKWMGDLPTDRYTFLYRFSAEAGTEGMEHANGTFISVPAAESRKSMSAVDNVTAHELFHLWNVMRIRPCSMEPIEFAHEQYSSTLWFSEGFTSAASRLFLLQAGYMTEADFLDRVAGTLSDLQGSPANSWQSAEDASLSVWLSGSEAYDSPERSVSCYRKGELLGILLDLRIRKETDGQRSIRDLFRSLETTYGATHRCFREGEAIQAAVEALTGRSESQFFQMYVAGHDDLPFGEYLAFVGLAIDKAGIHPQGDASAEQLNQRRDWLQERNAP
jgi:predicted metalloprotease with PDZ domain